MVVTNIFSSLSNQLQVNLIISPYCCIKLYIFLPTAPRYVRANDSVAFVTDSTVVASSVVDQTQITTVKRRRCLQRNKIE